MSSLNSEIVRIKRAVVLIFRKEKSRLVLQNWLHCMRFSYCVICLCIGVSPFWEKWKTANRFGEGDQLGVKELQVTSTSPEHLQRRNDTCVERVAEAS